MPQDTQSSGTQIGSTIWNALIAFVNGLESDIADLAADIAELLGLITAKPDLCSTAGQDIASSGAAGSASRCDHVHRGVSRIIAGSNITISPSTGYGAVTVTGEAGGAGAAPTEGDWTGYNLYKSLDMGTSFDGVTFAIFSADETLVYWTLSGAELHIFDVEAGTDEVVDGKVIEATRGILADWSIFHKYIAMRNTTGDHIYVYKNNLAFDDLTVEGFEDPRYNNLAMSMTGRFIFTDLRTGTYPYTYYLLIYKAT